MNVKEYHDTLHPDRREICEELNAKISKALPEAESKVWHGAPVWFLDGNPIVGYSDHKNYVKLLFWSGQSFEDSHLKPEGKFKAADVCFEKVVDVNNHLLSQWLEKSKSIQWDYKNIVKRRGELVRLK